MDQKPQYTSKEIPAQGVLKNTPRSVESCSLETFWVVPNLITT